MFLLNKTSDFIIFGFILIVLIFVYPLIQNHIEMKNIIFLSFFLSFSFSVVAQFHKEPNRHLQKAKPEVVFNNHAVYPLNEMDIPNNKAQKSSLINREEMGKSGNVFSVLHPEQRCIFYDEKSNSVVFTHSADTIEYPDALSKNTVMYSYTNNGNFNDWEHEMILNTSPETHHTKYPSVVFYNPSESQNIANIFAVVAGPDYSPSAGYNTYFASSKMDQSEQHIAYHPWESANDWARSSMTTVNEDVYIFGQDFQNVGDYGVNQTLKQYVGSNYNASDGFEWDINAVSPDWLISDEGYAYALYTTWGAWKRDGSIGYMWMVGVTNESSAYGVYQPQVYYTTDGGNSWQYIELNLEDVSPLQQFLPPWEDENGNAMGVRPSFLTDDLTFPGVVDFSGRLHLLSNVYGSTRGDVTQADDGNWVSETHPGGIIFDFIIKPEGLDEILFIDSIRSQTLDTAFGNISFNHRLQVAKTQHEQAVIVSWLDDESSEDRKLHHPDIKVASLCATYNGLLQVDNISAGDLYEGFYFFPYLAENTGSFDPIYDGAQLFMSTSVTPLEITENDPTSPITHFFIEGVSAMICSIGIDEDTMSYNKIHISQNTPNPTFGNTTIHVSSLVIAPVKVEVYHMMGQMVYSNNEGIIDGEMDIELDLSGERAGVYFYTITVGDTQISKKMILEKAK